jgi:hypothetical protein
MFDMSIIYLEVVVALYMNSEYLHIITVARW